MAQSAEDAAFLDVVRATEQSTAADCATIRTMASTLHRARITGPVSYLGHDGRHCDIPQGPCLLEQCGGPLVDIIWGAMGNNSAALPAEAIITAEDRGHLVLLD